MRLLCVMSLNYNFGVIHVGSQHRPLETSIKFISLLANRNPLLVESANTCLTLNIGDHTRIQTYSFLLSAVSVE